MARWAGLFLALLSCVYLANVYRNALNGPGYAALRWPPLDAWLAALSVCTLAMAVVASGWYLMIRASSGQASFLRAFAAFGLAQPAKYLPGNVWHFATRHLLGRADGHAHGSLVFASGLEAASLIAAALSLVAVLGLPSSPADKPWVASIPFLAASLGLLFVAFASAIVRGGSRAGFWLALHLLCALSYFACSAFAFWLLGDAGVRLLQPQILLSAVALSWVGGFIVIGAPGGFGVREALVLQLLSEGNSDSALLATALAWRACTIFADLAIFAMAWLLSRRLADSSRD